MLSDLQSWSRIWVILVVLTSSNNNNNNNTATTNHHHQQQQQQQLTKLFQIKSLTQKQLKFLQPWPSRVSTWQLAKGGATFAESFGEWSCWSLASIAIYRYIQLACSLQDKEIWNTYQSSFMVLTLLYICAVRCISLYRVNTQTKLINQCVKQHMHISTCLTHWMTKSWTHTHT